MILLPTHHSSILMVFVPHSSSVDRCVDVLVRFVAGDGLGESQT